jgi:asparagine synthase (glutamine-hydrolysing)
MCGISGIIYFDKEKNITRPELKMMTDSIIHRGPDDEGFYINRNVGLGFRRLSIIDLKTGNQPISNSDQSIWIVFNGEIYNFLELRIKLLDKGYCFKTQTDTEVIIHLYEEYGKGCLKYLRGMFAFAIWDNNINQLFCARDRFGIKPFFYYLDDDKFVFGSEIKTILKVDGIDKTLSAEAIDSYFAFGYITSDLSIYKKVKKLQPGFFLTISSTLNHSLKIENYWSINFKANLLRSESQWVEEIEACFLETVKLHMISDVPIGAFLSGGIDSSSVVAMMSKIANCPIKTFSIGFKEFEFNELSFAREIARKYNTEHHEFLLGPASIDLLPTLVSEFDEPFGDSSAIPTYFVSKFTREYVTVALSGDGGDELFAGYSAYSKLLSIRNKNMLPDKISKVIFSQVKELIPDNWPGNGLLYYLSQKKKDLGAYYCLWKESERMKLFQNDFFKQIDYKGEKYKESLLQNFSSTDFMTNLQELDIKTYMVDDILTKVDRASMLNSLEVRVPLLDHVFAELTFSIPASLKFHNGQQKYIFKKAMSKFLTPSVLQHRKQGFAVPLNYWFKEDLFEYIGDVLQNKNAKAYQYLDYDYVQKQFMGLNKQFGDKSSKIWSVLFFNEWLNQIV